MTNYRITVLILVSLLFCTIFSINAQDVEVVIKRIRSTKGQIIIGIFKDNKSFKEDKPYLRKKFIKNGVSNGELTVKFSLPPGTYGFALLDDENNDGKMNYNVIGIPKEGFGFSDYYLTGLSRPDFDEFKFTLNKDQNRKITIKIRYI